MHKDPTGQLNLVEPIEPAVGGSMQAAAYRKYYEALTSLREEFHRTGRFDDSNAKLDEIVKLLVVLIHERERAAGGQQDRLTQDWLMDRARTEFGDPGKVAPVLRVLSEEVLRSPRFQNPDGSHVFGSNPGLNLQPTDDRFALQVIRTVRALLPSVKETDHSAARGFDVLNESFGHFVRDSFRNNIEDAQYMTPPEVVTAMAQLALVDLRSDRVALQRLLRADPRDPFVLLDPTSGVGSFLVQGALSLTQLIHEHLDDDHQRLAATTLLRDHVYGQDKVDRMVRLSKLNVMLFGGGGGSVWQGNSILDGSQLDKLEGRVDLILTNPPFGARYSVSEVLKIRGARRFPALAKVMQDRSPPASTTGFVDSEILLLDRCLSLLRPGGRLLIVLPDNTVSAKGIPSALREAVAGEADIVAVVELPSVTFAQAGTRTKTCFVYLQRRADPPRKTQHRIFMGVCNDLGYRVVARTGVPVKIYEGRNELPSIVAAYERSRVGEQPSDRGVTVVSETPSAVWIPGESLINGRWTPNFYQARRLEALEELRGLGKDEFDLKKLSDVADLVSRRRRQATIPPGARVISVLHVGADGTLNLGEVESYSPKGLGLPCKPGDVLISRINPHIPRVCVVPETTFPLTCSTEFEILAPQSADPYVLAAILTLEPVQAQIQCLTSGTSSSHNRIKDTELSEVVVAIPKAGSAADQQLASIAERIKTATHSKYAAEEALRDARQSLGRAIRPGSSRGAAS